MAKVIISDLLKVFKSSVNAVLPEILIRKSFKYSEATKVLTVEGHHYNVENKNIYLVGTGKAVQNMAREVEIILSSRIIKGIVSIPEGSLNKTQVTKNVLYYEGAKNNLPDVSAENTSKKIRELVSDLKKDDLLLVLISGGGSALMCLPKEPITLEEKAEVIKKLAHSGADIKELNTVRIRLSDLKGGRLAAAAHPAQVISLILSDIVGDPLDLIASGPTHIDNEDPNAPIDIIKKYNLFNSIPESIKTALNKSVTLESLPKDSVRNYIIGSNKISIAAAVEEARNLHYRPIELSNTVTGNVKDIALEYCKLVINICNFLKGDLDELQLTSKIEELNIPGIQFNAKDISKDKDICLILGGEITVEVKGKGKGGRNQQLALEFSDSINSFKNETEDFHVYLLSAGTDGIDGPTDAAGAIGYSGLIADAIKENLDVKYTIDNNDAYNFFKNFKNGSLHVITGHTNTNVMDIHLILIKRKNF